MKKGMYLLAGVLAVSLLGEGQCQGTSDALEPFWRCAQSIG